MRTKIISALVLIALMIMAELANAQRVFFTSNKYEANVVAYITNYRTEADLVVCITKYQIEANTIGRWYIANSKYNADWVVFLTPNRLEADINIYWTTYPSLAGYQTNKRQIIR